MSFCFGRLYLPVQHNNSFASSFSTQTMDTGTKNRRYRPKSLISRPAFCRCFFVCLAMRSPQCTRRTILTSAVLVLRSGLQTKLNGSPNRSVPPAAHNTSVFTAVQQAPALTCPPPVAPLRSSGKAAKKQTTPFRTFN